jgi:ligand-binding sensor domain-containing protein/serine phosphatase RsbU (regulator of sigma subunit)
MRLFLLALLGAFLLQSAVSQDFYFEQISIEEGLSNEKVYCVFEDLDHFVWLGTKFGVSIYDGQHIQNLSVNDGLATGGVKSIVQDRFGDMYFGHYDGGLSHYNGSYSSIDTLPITNHIYDFLEHHDFLWIATTGNGLFRVPLSPDKRSWDFSRAKQFLGKDGLSDRVFDALALQDGSLVFVTDVGLKQYNPNTELFINFKEEIIPGYFQITRVYQAKDGRLFIGTYNGGLYILDLKTDTIRFIDKKFGLPNNFIMDITEGENGVIWIATFGGGVVNYTHDKLQVFDASNGFPDQKVQSLLVSFQGLLLAGTDATGLQIFKGSQFINYNELGIMDERGADAIKWKENHLFVGSEKGLIQFALDMDDGRSILEENIAVPNLPVRYLEQDQKDGLWLAGELDGVYHYSTATKKLVSVQALNPYFRLNRITALEVDTEGKLWIGTLEGLLRYDPETNEVERLSQENGINRNHISAIFASKERIWVGSRQSQQGINYIQGKTVFQLPLPMVLTPTCFFENGNEVWIGTENQGIFVVQDDSLAGIHTTDEGLISNHIAFISKDKNGDIWVGSQKGISILDKASGKFWTGYGNRQGFEGMDCLQESFDFDSHGDLWIGTSRGFLKNTIDHRRKPIGIIKPLISSLKINGEQYVGDLTSFAFKQNDLEFKLNAVDLYAPEKLRWSYKVNGITNQWEQFKGDKSLNLFALQPGSYSLELSIFDSNGATYTLSQPFNWIINPPWYRTWWAILIFLLLLLGLTYGYIKYREQNLKREKRILEQRVEERTHLVMLKNNQLEQKNQDITDSLHYASGIQEAVLPELDELRSNGFIYYKPKDIVSGDFYFIANSMGSLYICAADCTGHGVPGALLSIMGVNLMDSILKQNPRILPDHFLDLLNLAVSDTLRQDESHGLNDGMDLALVKIDFSSETLYYAGAFNALYLIRNHELMEYKADRFSIGSGKYSKDRTYNLKKISYQNGDRMYIFSDGLADQFGGPIAKKLKSSGLKKLLLEIQSKPIDGQKKEIESFMREWKGDEEQIDDMLLIGFELNKNFDISHIHD